MSKSKATKPIESAKIKTVEVSSLKRQQDERFVGAYANYAIANAGPLDLRIVFSEIIQLPPETPYLHDKASVTMPISLVPELIRVLETEMKKWHELRATMLSRQDSAPPQPE